MRRIFKIHTLSRMFYLCTILIYVCIFLKREIMTEEITYRIFVLLENYIKYQRAIQNVRKYEFFRDIVTN